jgi:signal transduction histidine kinase
MPMAGPMQSGDGAAGRRGLLGVLIGIPVGAAGVLLALVTGGGAMFPALPIVAIAWVGLRLGWQPAIWSYVGAGLTAWALIIGLHPSGLLLGEAFQILWYVVLTPVVILMARSVQSAREGAEAARDAAVKTQRELEERRIELERTHLELSAVWRKADESRARLEEVAEAIPEPLIVFDADARGTYANRAALRTFGRSFTEPTVDGWARLAEPRDEHGAPLPRSEWPQIRGAREEFTRRLLMRLPMSDRDLLIDVEGTPVPDGGCVLLMRDVGKEVDEQQRLSRFASFVAHELRNPLAVAKARMELAQRPGSRPQRATHAVRALESVDAAIGILEGLELFSLAEAGRLEASREPFDVAEAVAAAIERLRVRGSERQVSVTTLGRTHAIGDRALAEQAITNLLTNADRYSEPDAPVEVSVRDGDWLELRVADVGPGIADDLVAVLFRERVSSGRGLGLGLYLVNAAMQAQGGSVVLETRRPGAVFLLRWPIAPEEEAA